VKFIPGMQGWFNYEYQSMQYTILINDKNHMITSINTEKAFDKIQHPFIIKILGNQGIKGNFLNLIKGIYEKKKEKTTANIMLMVKD